MVNLKLKNFENWISQNRLLLWWFIFIPLLILVIAMNWKYLTIAPDILGNEHLSFQYKVFNSTALIIMARITLIAIGLLVVMVCLFFPALRLSKEGVQWTKEIEVLAEASGEITGEAIGELIREESMRWNLIYGWLKIQNQTLSEPEFLLRELLATLWEAFPDSKICLSLCEDNRCYTLTKSLLPKLVPGEVSEINSRVNAFGLEFHFAEEKQLLLDIYPGSEHGFSRIDEGFMLILEEIIKQEISRRQFSVEQLLTYFDKEILT